MHYYSQGMLQGCFIEKYGKSARVENCHNESELFAQNKMSPYYQ